MTTTTDRIVFKVECSECGLELYGEADARFYETLTLHAGAHATAVVVGDFVAEVNR